MVQVLLDVEAPKPEARPALEVLALGLGVSFELLEVLVVLETLELEWAEPLRASVSLFPQGVLQEEPSGKAEKRDAQSMGQASMVSESEPSFRFVFSRKNTF